VLSVFLWFRDSDCPFGIFKLLIFCILAFCHVHICMLWQFRRAFFWRSYFPLDLEDSIINFLPSTVPTFLIGISQNICILAYYHMKTWLSLDRGLLLIRKLLYQGFLLVKLKSSLRKFYGCHHDLVDRYGMSVSQMTSYMFHLSWALPDPFLFHELSLGL
jgi:hypothetical protein